MDKDVLIVTGAGQISMAIARRVGAGRKIVMGDKKTENARAIAELLMSDKGTFITGSTFLMDGGATASYYYGPLRPAA